MPSVSVDICVEKLSGVNRNKHPLFNGLMCDIQTHTGKEGNVLFNDALNTFYLQLYGVGHVVKDYSVRGNLL